MVKKEKRIEKQKNIQKKFYSLVHIIEAINYVDAEELKCKIKKILDKEKIPTYCGFIIRGYMNDKGKLTKVTRDKE